MSWYGDDPLAVFAPALAGLAPPPAAWLHPNSGIAGTVRLSGPAQTLALPVRLDPGMAPGTVGLNYAALSALGVGHGDPIGLEIAT